MKPQEPSQNEKLAKNLFFNFKPPYLKNPFSDFKFFGLYPHYIGYALSCVKISAKSNHKFLSYSLKVNAIGYYIEQLQTSVFRPMANG